MNDIYIKYITKVPFNKKFDGFNNLISIPYVLLIFVFPIKYFLTGSVRHDPKITHGICRTLYCYKKKTSKTFVHNTNRNFFVQKCWTDLVNILFCRTKIHWKRSCNEFSIVFSLCNNNQIIINLKILKNVSPRSRPQSEATTYSRESEPLIKFPPKMIAYQLFRIRITSFTRSRNTHLSLTHIFSYPWPLFKLPKLYISLRVVARARKIANSLAGRRLVSRARRVRFTCFYFRFALV